MQDNKGGFWFTTKTGKHVHVEEGETPKQAAERAFKGKQSQSDKKVSLSYEPETKDADIKGEDFFAYTEEPEKPHINKTKDPEEFHNALKGAKESDVAYAKECFDFAYEIGEMERLFKEGKDIKSAVYLLCY